MAADETLKKLQVILDGNTQQLQVAMKQAEQSTTQATTQIQKGLDKVDVAFKKVAKAAAAYISVKALVNFSKSCVQLGSDLAEVQNVVDVTFGSMSGKIDEFAKGAIKQFGLSETAAKQYSSTMGAMLKSMGMTVDKAYDMSTTLTGLAGDIASFYNLSADEAFAKLRSGISGETEPLKQLGINLSTANLEAYALSKGITKAYSSMSQAEQATLRYNYLLSVTSDAQGDFARTSGGWANQVRILSMQFDSLKASLGQGLIYALTPAIKVLNRLMERLRQLAETFRVVMAILTGNDLNESMQDNMAGVADSAEGAAGSVDTITDSMQDAEKAAKRFLYSFDEIHKMQDSKDIGLDTDNIIDELISLNAVNGVDDASDAVDGLNDSLGMTQEQIEQLQKKLQPVAVMIQRIKKRVGALADTASAWWDEHAPAMLEAWNNDIKPALEHWGEKLDELWNEHLLPLLSGAASLVSSLWHNVLEPFVQWFMSQGFDYIVNTIGDLADLGGGLLSAGAGFVNYAGAGVQLVLGNTDKATELSDKATEQFSTGLQRMWQGAGGIGAGLVDVFEPGGNVHDQWEDMWRGFYGAQPYAASSNIYGNAGAAIPAYAGAASGSSLTRDDVTEGMLDALNNAPESELAIYMDGEQVGSVITRTMSYRNVRVNPNTAWIKR